MELGFAYENLGELSSEAVAAEMRRSDIHLSFSLTNVSWVPFEAMACGCAVVEADTENVAAMLGREQGACLLTDPTAEAVAAALLRLIREPALREQYSRQALEFIGARTKAWEDSCEDFERLLRRAVFADEQVPEKAKAAN